MGGLSTHIVKCEVQALELRVRVHDPADEGVAAHIHRVARLGGQAGCPVVVGEALQRPGVIHIQVHMPATSHTQATSVSGHAPPRVIDTPNEEARTQSRCGARRREGPPTPPAACPPPHPACLQTPLRPSSGGCGSGRTRGTGNENEGGVNNRVCVRQASQERPPSTRTCCCNILRRSSLTAPALLVPVDVVLPRPGGEGRQTNTDKQRSVGGWAL
jgi:hypothetical protein